MITYQEETLKQIRSKELDEILKLNSKELTKFSFPLNPDWTVYEQLERTNSLHIITVRDEGKLIGYYWSIIVQHHHYKDMMIAENDIHYLLPEYRKGWLGYKFLKEVIKLLKLRNIDVIIHSMKSDNSYLPITERLGFKLMDYKLIMEV